MRAGHACILDLVPSTQRRQVRSAAAAGGGSLPTIKTYTGYLLLLLSSLLLLLLLLLLLPAAAAADIVMRRDFILLLLLLLPAAPCCCGSVPAGAAAAFRCCSVLFEALRGHSVWCCLLLWQPAQGGKDKKRCSPTLPSAPHSVCAPSPLRVSLRSVRSQHRPSCGRRLARASGAIPTVE
jgi:hypothetical protein